MTALPRRVGIVGGGPAGLYTAILLKRDDPTREVRLLERNPEGATYGWGVVFSADTLAELRDADYDAWVRLDEQLTRWDALDVRYRGTRTRAHGHGFSAVRRTALLGVLTDRARELGVEIRFDTEVADPRDPHAAFDGADLIVAADGVNSSLRDARADELGTRTEQMTTRFAWFGATRAFEAFTFIFAETDHGLFTVHAYPIDADTSTFIVECRPEAFRAAGLDEMSEQDSLTWCEELFADHLGGAELRSNRSIWHTFTTVRNRRWFHDDVVLVGDAAASAHFTIGSGTKLAVEDAAALAKAFTEHPGETEAALTAYELARQAPTERFQDAAGDSARYFASVGRYLGFAPAQFTFNLLTRSGRVTHRDVEARDPVVAVAADRHVAEQVGSDPPGEVILDPPSRQPLALRELTLANRVAVAPPPEDAADAGIPGREATARLTAAARLGAGLVITDLVAVTPAGRVTPGSPGLYDDGHAGAWAEAVAAMHDAGARVAVRLGHAGQRGATRPRHRFLDRPLPAGQAWELIAPTAEPYLGTGAPPRPATDEDLGRLTEDFAAAAARAAEAGVDVLVLDCSDGYLLGSWLSPLTNTREDRHGGDLDARLAWPTEVVAAVREAWPPDRPLGVRLICDDRRPGGLTPDEAVAAARRLTAAGGVDVLQAASGHTVPWFGGTAYRPGWGIQLADVLRNETGVPTVAAGGITTLDEIDTAVAAGRADVCVLDPRRYAQRRVTPLAGADRDEEGGTHG